MTPPPSAIRRILSDVLPPLGLSVMAAAALIWASGWTLGVFLGGLLLITLLIPPAVLRSVDWRGQTVAIGVSVIPILVLWLMAARRTQTTVAEWATCGSVLVAYALAVAGLAAAFRRIGLSATVSAALAVVAGLAWLTWPIWLSRTWSGEASAASVDWFLTFHPALVINLPHLGQWVEQSVAYHLTDLNQNVPYAPPGSVWGCVAFHGVAGVALLGAAAWRPARRTDGTATSPADAVV